MLWETSFTSHTFRHCLLTLFSVPLPWMLLLIHPSLVLSRNWLYSAETLRSSHLAIQEIPRILWNPRVHYRFYKSPPFFLILSQANFVHTVHFICLRLVSRFFSNLRVGLSSEVFPSGFHLYIACEYNIGSRVQYWNNSNSFILTCPVTVSVASFFDKVRRLLTGLVGLCLIHGCAYN